MSTWAHISIQILALPAPRYHRCPFERCNLNSELRCRSTSTGFLQSSMHSVCPQRRKTFHCLPWQTPYCIVRLFRQFVSLTIESIPADSPLCLNTISRRAQLQRHHLNSASVTESYECRTCSNYRMEDFGNLEHKLSPRRPPKRSIRPCVQLAKPMECRASGFLFWVNSTAACGDLPHI